MKTNDDTTHKENVPVSLEETLTIAAGTSDRIIVTTERNSMLLWCSATMLSAKACLAVPVGKSRSFIRSRIPTKTNGTGLIIAVMARDRSQKLIHRDCAACGDDFCTFEVLPTTAGT
jgi:hypothetical protein